MDIAKEISKSLSERLVIAKVRPAPAPAPPHRSPLILIAKKSKRKPPLPGRRRPMGPRAPARRPVQARAARFRAPGRYAPRSAPSAPIHERLTLTNRPAGTGKKVFWHSSAHVLGEASERHYGCHLCIGPPTDEGFFYEMAIEDRSVSLSLLLSFAVLLSRLRALFADTNGFELADP